MNFEISSASIMVSFVITQFFSAVKCIKNTTQNRIYKKRLYFIGINPHRSSLVIPASAEFLKLMENVEKKFRDDSSIMRRENSEAGIKNQQVPSP